MTLFEKLLFLTEGYRVAKTKLGKAIALYELRQFLIGTHQGELMASIEVQLHDSSTVLYDLQSKDCLRAMGFQFPEDLDNCIELLCDKEEDSDGLFRND